MDAEEKEKRPKNRSQWCTERDRDNIINYIKKDLEGIVIFIFVCACSLQNVVERVRPFVSSFSFIFACNVFDVGRKTGKSILIIFYDLIITETSSVRQPVGLFADQFVAARQRHPAAGRLVATYLRLGFFIIGQRRTR